MFYLGLSLNRFVHVFSLVNTFAFFKPRLCLSLALALGAHGSCPLVVSTFSGAGGGGWGCWQSHPRNTGCLSPRRGCPLWGMAAAGPLPVLESRRVLGASLCIPSRDQKDQQLKNLIEKVLWKRKVKLRNSY